MQIKNRKSILIIFLLGLFSFNLSLYAEEFDISAKEVAIDNASQILIGTGSVMAKDSEGKIIYADKIRLLDNSDLKWWNKAMPKISKHQFHGSHMFPFEKPRELAELINKILESGR